MKKIIFILLLSACSSSPKNDSENITPPPSSEEVLRETGDVSQKIHPQVHSSLKYASSKANVMVELQMTWAEVDDCRDAIDRSGAQLHPGPALVPNVYIVATVDRISLKKLALLRCVKSIVIEKKLKNIDLKDDDSE